MAGCNNMSQSTISSVPRFDLAIREHELKQTLRANSIFGAPQRNPLLHMHNTVCEMGEQATMFVAELARHRKPKATRKRS